MKFDAEDLRKQVGLADRTGINEAGGRINCPACVSENL